MKRGMTGFDGLRLWSAWWGNRSRGPGGWWRRDGRGAARSPLRETAVNGNQIERVSVRDERSNRQGTWSAGV